MSFGDLHSTQWAVLMVSAFILGFSKTGMPGIGILAIPLVAAVIPAKASTGLILPMLIVGDIFAVAYYKRHAVWRHLLRLFPFTTTGVVAGYFAMDHVSDAQLKPIIGVVVLVMLALNYWRQHRAKGALVIPTGWWFPAVLGFMAGVTTMMANAAGPIMTIYLLAMGLPKDAFIGTGAWYFLLMNSFKVPFSANLGLITRSSLLCNLALTPGIVIGALLGVRIASRLPEGVFTAIVQILTIAGAVRLLF